MSKKHQKYEYIVYDEEEEIIDVLFLTRKEAKTYESNNPSYTLEEVEDELLDE
jgi:hypothetical protein